MTMSITRERSKYIALVLAFSIMLVLGSFPLAAHAAEVKTPTQKCMVHDIHLHGNQPATITCAQTGTQSQAVSPNISWDHCSGSNPRLEIISSTSGSYCFYDAGYIGLSGITNVTTVKSLAYYDWANQKVYGSGWLLYYYYPWTSGTGQKFYFGNGSTYNCGNSAFCSSNQIKVTQVDLNS